ncbi:hypothetical protein U1Q18_001358 [Sarracenia purpurea var. burkii]
MPECQSDEQASIMRFRKDHVLLEANDGVNPIKSYTLQAGIADPYPPLPVVVVDEGGGRRTRIGENDRGTVAGVAGAMAGVVNAVPKEAKSQDKTDAVMVERQNMATGLAVNSDLKATLGGCDASGGAWQEDGPAMGLRG